MSVGRLGLGFSMFLFVLTVRVFFIFWGFYGFGFFLVFERIREGLGTGFFEEIFIVLC